MHTYNSKTSSGKRMEMWIFFFKSYNDLIQVDPFAIIMSIVIKKIIIILHLNIYTIENNI